MLKHSSDIPAEAGNSARFERSDLLTVTKVGIDIVETSPERRPAETGTTEVARSQSQTTKHCSPRQLPYAPRRTLISSARAEDYRDLASAVYRSRPPQHRATRAPKCTGSSAPNSRTVSVILKAEYERFKRNNIRIRYWSWYYRSAGAGTRLVLQLILADSSSISSFQTLTSIDQRCWSPLCLVTASSS